MAALLWVAACALCFGARVRVGVSTHGDHEVLSALADNATKTSEHSVPDFGSRNHVNVEVVKPSSESFEVLPNEGDVFVKRANDKTNQTPGVLLMKRPEPKKRPEPNAEKSGAVLDNHIVWRKDIMAYQVEVLKKARTTIRGVFGSVPIRFWISMATAILSVIGILMILYCKQGIVLRESKVSSLLSRGKYRTINTRASSGSIGNVPSPISTPSLRDEAVREAIKRAKGGHQFKVSASYEWYVLRDSDMAPVEDPSLVKSLDAYAKEASIRPQVAFKIEAWTLARLRRHVGRSGRKIGLQIGDRVWYERKTYDEVGDSSEVEGKTVENKTRRKSSGGGTPITKASFNRMKTLLAKRRESSIHQMLRDEVFEADSTVIGDEKTSVSTRHGSEMNAELDEKHEEVDEKPVQVL
ncbi:hypothetical protein AAMO2058_001545900 [Amorphochlora amoebiformis]